MNTPIDIVKRFYACLQAGDQAGLGALLAEDVVLHVPGRHQLAGDYAGPEGIAREFVAALCRVQAQRPGHAALDNSTLHLAKVRSGRIAEIWFHNFDQHAVDAFWGQRPPDGRS